MDTEIAELKDRLFGQLSAKNKKIRKEQILVLAVSAVLAGLYVLTHRPEVLKDGYILPRGDYGAQESVYDLRVEGLPEGRQDIRVVVRAREYTEEEARAAFEEISESAGAYILGENSSLQELSEDLRFPKSLPDYPGIRLSWYPADTMLISSRGEVLNQRLEAPAGTFLRLRMKAGGIQDEVILPVTVLPASRTDTFGWKEKLSVLIEEKEAEQINDSFIDLPAEIYGQKISYASRRDLSWIRILLAGVAAAAALGLKPAQDRKKAEKARESELLLDYADLVSRLMVYLGAGLTIRNAWKKITNEYEEARAAGRTGTRQVYEEMIRTSLELDKGIPERRAYMEFAHRCGPRCYLRLASILEQNLRTGDKRMGNALELEMQEAFEQRRNTAHRLGEEAGTKLILPLILSLLAVLMIVTVPAMLTLT